MCFPDKGLEGGSTQRLKKGASVSEGFQEIRKSYLEHQEEKEKDLQQQQVGLAVDL